MKQHLQYINTLTYQQVKDILIKGGAELLTLNRVKNIHYLLYITLSTGQLI